MGDEVTLMQRELDRAHALLAMEEQRNRPCPPSSRPPIEPSTSDVQRGAAEYLAFLEDDEMLTMKDYFDPALIARKGRSARHRSSSSTR